jgi:hypothetical protein
MFMNSPAVPDDFPRQPWPGALAGAQPKLLVRRIGDRLISGLTEQELFARYEMCEDLARQLAPYTQRKMAENPGWSLDETLSKVGAAAAHKVQRGQWDLSSDELTWLQKRIRQLLVPTGGGDAC